MKLDQAVIQGYILGREETKREAQKAGQVEEEASWSQAALSQGNSKSF